MKRSELQQGFTLMEIVVATTIFATVLTLMLVLLNYTLKINRKVEALRQVSQATRNFTEFLVREIRNGTIDYSGSISSLCPSTYNTSTNATYLALISRSGDRECFHLIANGNSGSLWVEKKSITGVTTIEKVNPDSVNIDPNTFRLFVRPTTNPQALVGVNYPGVQPFVTILMHLSVQLNNADGPAVIPYQTTVSTDVYDIRHR